MCMTSKDNSIEFYHLPYNHRLRVFDSYIKNNRLDLKNYNYYTYLISNPININYSKTNNNQMVKVAILVESKNDGSLKLQFTEFDFNSILLLNTFSEIKMDGSTTLFEQGSNKYNKFIDRKTLNIKDTTKYEVLSLVDVQSRFEIFSKVDIEKISEFKNLEFYLYTIDNRKVLIPAIEVMKYFYLFNYQKTLTSHFCNDILTPSGIKHSLNTLVIKDSHYEFEINGNYSEVDRYKILFFITNSKRLELYSKVYSEYEKYGKISTPIPLNSVRMDARIFNYKKQNLSLVLNIISHNYGDDFDYDFTYNYTHAKSQFREIDIGKRDTSKDVNKVNSSSNLGFDDNLYGNSDYQYSKSSNEYLEENIKFEQDHQTISLNGTKTKTKQREQQGGKVQVFNEQDSIPLTTKSTIGNNNIAISNNMPFENTLKNEYDITIEKIIDYMKDRTLEFSFIFSTSFSYPRVYEKGKEKKVSFMFTDKNKYNRREYIIAKFKYYDLELYLIEIQPQFNGTTKSLLAIFMDNEDVYSINYKYIKKELTDFVLNSNRKWFSGKVYMNENSFFTYKHSGSLEGFESKLKEKMMNREVYN